MQTSMADISVKRSSRNSSQLNWSLCVIMLGDSGTGKTSLVEKFVGKSKEEVNKFMSAEKELERKGYKVVLEIRDTAGKCERSSIAARPKLGKA